MVVSSYITKLTDECFYRETKSPVDKLIKKTGRSDIELPSGILHSDV